MHNHPSDSRFLIAEIHAMMKSKWIESEQLHKDLTTDEKWYHGWIEKHGAQFRDAWCTSCCRDCENLEKCNDQLKIECINFKCGFTNGT